MFNKLLIETNGFNIGDKIHYVYYDRYFGIYEHAEAQIYAFLVTDKLTLICISDVYNEENAILPSRCFHNKYKAVNFCIRANVENRF